MKKLNKIIIWAMLSIMMQCAGLLYIDKVFLKHSSEFTAQEVEITAKNIEANVSIPTNAEKVEVSSNGRYITYTVDGKFMLVNIKTSEIKQILEDTEILLAGWAPSNNNIMVVEKKTSKSSGTVVNYKTYNPNTGIENDVSVICDYQKGMEVDNNVVTTAANYVSISRGGNSTTIYKINVNDEVKKLENKVPKLGSIAVFPINDILLYEDSLNKYFYRYTKGTRNKLNFQNANSLVILGVRNDKIIYMGEKSEEKVVKIIYGADETSPSTWKTVMLEKSKDTKDIYIYLNNKDESQILVNDDLEGKVKNIITGDVITYEGKFISVNDKVICSSDNGKIYLKSVTDVDKKEETTSKK